MHWSTEWQKCKAMHFGRHNAPFNYTLDSKLLVKVSEKKTSVLCYQVTYKFSQQCAKAYQYSKASKLLGILNRPIVYKSKDIMLKMYNSLVHPHLEYCTTPWSPHYVKDKELLKLIQRHFTRMIPELKELT